MDESVALLCDKSTREKKKKIWSEIQWSLAGPPVLGCVVPPCSGWDAVGERRGSSLVKQLQVSFSHSFVEKSVLDLILE